MGPRPNDFDRQIEQFQEYIATLRELPVGEQQNPDGSLFEALNTAVEELRVAGEELQEQNDQLVEAREAAEREAARFQALFDFAPDGYIVTDSNGVILDVNQAASEMLVVASDFLVGKPLVLYVEQQDIREFLSQLEEIKRKKAIKDWEIRMAARSSGSFEASIDAISELDQTGTPVKFRWMIRDVTERNRMARELFESESRFQTIFNGIDVGIMLLDLEGKILTVNPIFPRMVGYSPEELRNKAFSDLVHPGARAENHSVFQEVASGKRDHFSGESQLTNQNREALYVKLTYSLARSQGGRPQYIIALAENVTVQKQMESELVDVERRLVDVGEAERLHLAQELHDGPLQDLYGVMYQVKLLSDSIDEGKNTQEMDRIRDALQRVIDLLRSTTGDLRPPTLAYFGLSKALISHVETLQDLYHDLEFHLELTEAKDNLSERVRLALFRIYQHCIMNVIRHAKADRVVIRFEITPSQIVLEVQDDGAGFVVPRRWSELVREGHFGLVGAAERAAGIGGVLKIRSKPGGGTTVRTVVPRREEDQRQKTRLSLLVSDLSPGGEH